LAAVSSGKINIEIGQVLLAAAVVVVLSVARILVVVLAVLLVVVLVVLVVVLVEAVTGAETGRYLDGVLQYPPKESVTLSLARVKPLARAQAILKTTSLFLIASIYFVKVY